MSLSANLFFITQTSREQGHSVESHVHSCDELVFYRDGEGKTTIDGKIYDFFSGNFAIIKAGTPHSEHHNQNSDVVFFGFHIKSPLFEIESGLYSYDGILVILKLIEKLFKEATEQKFNYEPMISAILIELFVCISRGTDVENSKVKDLSYCVNFISENFNQKINLKQLADMYGYSYDYFRHVFKEKIGLSPKSYIMAQRLERSCDMLKSSTKSCTQIAQDCGFSDSAQFSKLFKKQFGIAPTQFRL